MAAVNSTSSSSAFQCAECGACLAKGGPRLRYCSTCKIVVRRRNARARAEKKRNSVERKFHDRVCRRCCEGFRTQDPYNYYCSDCLAAAEVSGVSKYHFLSRKAEIVPVEMTCAACQKPFIRAWITQKYCCKICTTKAARETAEGRINGRVRAGIRRSLLGAKLKKGLPEMVGYSVDQLLDHLRRQLPKGLSIPEDLGRLHIDHIVPLCAFSFRTMDDPEFKAAWALTNLRPILAEDNLRKGGRRTHLL